MTTNLPVTGRTTTSKAVAEGKSTGKPILALLFNTSETSTIIRVVTTC